MYVVKADGTREVFKRDKLLSSLRTAGAKEKTAEAVIAHVERELVDGIHTADIYRHAFDVLHKLERPAAARYSLKRALIALGPAGFAFEKFVAEIFKAKGFKTALDVFAQGKCASHELDVVAWNDMSLILVEAKFHNELGMKSDTKVALYVKARFEDLRDASLMYGDHRKMTEGWLITNTKLTENATRYCECSGVRVIGWNYPPKGNLHDMIEETGLHPITCLTSLSGVEKQRLLEQGVVLCRDVRNKRELLSSVGISGNRLQEIIAESGMLCG